MDDIFIYSNYAEEHIAHVDEILKTPSEADVKLKINKCTLFIYKVE